MKKTFCVFSRVYLLGIFIFNFVLSDKAIADEISPIVVTATRQEQRVNESIASLTVIERDEINRFGGSTIGEVISRGVGVEISRQGSVGASESVFIRGANSGHTLVLIDGVRIGSASLGTTALEAIPLEQVERIEILRGPGSALYGSDAIGGVVNVITNAANQNTKSNLKASAGLGSQGTLTSNFSLAKKIDSTAYVVSVGVSKSDGINSLTKSANAYNPDNDGYSNKNIGLSISHTFNEDFQLGAGYLDSRLKNRYDSYQSKLPNYDVVNANLDYQRNLRATESNLYAKFSPNTKWMSTLRLSNGTDYSDQPSSFDESSNLIYRTAQRQFMWQNDIKLPIGKALLLVERLEQKLDSNSTYSSTGRSVNAYATGWNGKLDRNSFQFNFRQDKNSQYGVKNTDFLGYGYEISSYWNVATSISTAFKAPTFNDLYYPMDGDGSVGNAALKPEESKNREAGLRYDNGKIRGHITYFDNNIKNLISWSEYAPYSYTPYNTASARIKGEEIGLSIQNNSWRYKAEVTLQNPEDITNKTQLISRTKRHSLLSSYFSQRDYMLGVEVRYVGARYFDKTNSQSMGGYGLINLFGEYKLNNELTTFARLNNLFDRKYEMARSSTEVYGVPGATAFIGVRYSVR